MTKKSLYAPQAERLYAIEQCTIAEIAARLKINEKTIRTWKDEGGWETKRLQFLSSKQSFHEELFEFSRALMKSIKEDIEAKKDVDPGRMYAFTRLVGQINKVKEYEDQAVKPKENISPISKEEVFDIIQKALTGEE